ncbi:heme exporter protein CcmD [Rhizobium sp. 3T7]|uniref:heme exporter protein CcmD n=1 Tax=Rhizobium sp. 3T7 TaxID=2874922 RepID=UPI001CCD2B54|nr:heme exporter protein CcmD [Rhizobium sp. 3T7]MBZ9793879.1 heme exporter protein CcmD [Rhizobium sp. 3T7]
MDHQHYVVAAYALTFTVMLATAVKVWLAGRSYRRQVRGLATVRRHQPRDARQHA